MLQHRPFDRVFPPETAAISTARDALFVVLSSLLPQAEVYVPGDAGHRARSSPAR